MPTTDTTAIHVGAGLLLYFHLFVFFFFYYDHWYYCKDDDDDDGDYNDDDDDDDDDYYYNYSSTALRCYAIPILPRLLRLLVYIGGPRLPIHPITRRKDSRRPRHSDL